MIGFTDRSIESMCFTFPIVPLTMTLLAAASHRVPRQDTAYAHETDEKQEETVR